MIIAAVVLAGLLHQSPAEDTLPSVALSHDLTLVFKRFTQGDLLPANPRAPGKNYEHPDLRNGGADLKRRSSWPTKYLLAFDVRGAGKLDDWQVFAKDDDGYACEVQPYLARDWGVVWFQDPLPIGSRNITLLFKPADAARSVDEAKELVIANPFFVIPSVLKAEPLPQTRDCFGAQVALTKVVRRKSGEPVKFEFKVIKDREPFHGLQISDIFIHDGFGMEYKAGNWGRGGWSIGIKSMVPWRASLVWKLQLHVRRAQSAQLFADDECYRVDRLDRLTGRGNVVPGSPTLAPVTAELKDGNKLVIAWEQDWDGKKALLPLKVTDDQGRDIHSDSSSSESKVIEWPGPGVSGRNKVHTTFDLNVTPDAKWLSATFVIETPKVVEFVVAPQFVND